VHARVSVELVARADRRLAATAVVAVLLSRITRARPSSGRSVPRTRTIRASSKQDLAMLDDDIDFIRGSGPARFAPPAANGDGVG
jgi:hypothetical protein